MQCTLQYRREVRSVNGRVRKEHKKIKDDRGGGQEGRVKVVIMPAE